MESKTIDVLIVEDEPDYRAILAGAVRWMGLAPAEAADLSQARRILARHEVRLVLLDRMLGIGVDGLGLCLDLKKDTRTRHVPVIVLTAMDRFSEEIKGLRYGVDLYLRKPIDLSQLKKYIEGFLKRLPYKEESAGTLRYGDVAVSKTDRTVRVGRTVYRSLTKRQFDLLTLLVSRRGGSVSRRFLIRKLWRNAVRDREVDVLISRLKRRLNLKAAALIAPVRARGYRLALSLLPRRKAAA